MKAAGLGGKCLFPMLCHQGVTYLSDVVCRWVGGPLARINIDDLAFSDARIKLLAYQTQKPKFHVLGQLAHLWHHCANQQVYSVTPELIDAIAECEGFHTSLISVGLGKRTSSGEIQISGLKGRIEWIAKVRKNGKKGGRPKKPTGLAKGNQPQTKIEPTSNPLTLALAPSLAPALTQKKEEEERTLRVHETAVALPVEPKSVSKLSEATRNKMRDFLGAYASGWKLKYGGNPEGVRDKGLVGKVGHWIGTVSTERACALVQVYLQIDYRPINESYHDLWLFFRHLNRIGIALDSGSDPEGIDWSNVFGGGA